MAPSYGGIFFFQLRAHPLLNDSSLCQVDIKLTRTLNTLSMSLSLNNSAASNIIKPILRNLLFTNEYSILKLKGNNFKVISRYLRVFNTKESSNAAILTEVLLT